MKTKIVVVSLLFVWTVAVALTLVLPSNKFTLAWDYPTVGISPDLYFNLYLEHEHHRSSPDMDANRIVAGERDQPDSGGQRHEHYLLLLEQCGDCRYTLLLRHFHELLW